MLLQYREQPVQACYTISNISCIIPTAAFVWIILDNKA